MEVAWAVNTFVRVSTEVVTLCLQQVGRQNFSTVGVVVVDGSSQGWYRNTSVDGHGYDFTRSLLVLLGNVLEVVVQQQVLQFRILFKGIRDLLQELSTNNASFTPDLSQFRFQS